MDNPTASVPLDDEAVMMCSVSNERCRKSSSSSHNSPSHMAGLHPLERAELKRPAAAFHFQSSSSRGSSSRDSHGSQSAVKSTSPLAAGGQCPSQQFKQITHQ